MACVGRGCTSGPTLSINRAEIQAINRAEIQAINRACVGRGCTSGPTPPSASRSSPSARGACRTSSRSARSPPTARGYTGSACVCTSLCTRSVHTSMHMSAHTSEHMSIRLSTDIHSARAAADRLRIPLVYK